MADRDRQRRRVYAWETPGHRAPRPEPGPLPRRPGHGGRHLVGVGAALPACRWSPSPLRPEHLIADASRLTLRLRPLIPSWCLLHELAHAMTSTHDGQSDGHGPIFVGIYVQLLGRYLRLDQGWLLQTLQEAGVVVCPNARPAFLDR